MREIETKYVNYLYKKNRLCLFPSVFYRAQTATANDEITSFHVGISMYCVGLIWPYRFKFGEMQDYSTLDLKIIPSNAYDSDCQFQTLE